MLLQLYLTFLLAGDQQLEGPHHTDLWDAIGPSFFKLIIAHLFESSSLRCHPNFFVSGFQVCISKLDPRASSPCCLVDG